MRLSRVVLFIAVLAVFSPQTVPAAAFHNIDNLASVTFWEITGSLNTAYTFNIDSSQLMNRLASLNQWSYDFYGVAGHEYYDVFYSDADGTFNVDGSYLTIEGVWDYQAPYGGGLNLAEMGLNFSDESRLYGNTVTSYVALGNNAIPSSVPYAIDGDLRTATTIGNTVGQTERLRLTLGFITSTLPDPVPSPVPVPSALVLLGSGLLGLMRLRKRFA